MTSEMWMILWPQLSAAVPQMLAFLATFICALVLRRRCLRAAILAAAGCAILFLNMSLGTFFSAYLMGMHQSGEIAMNQYVTIITIISLIRRLLAVVGFVFVFIAVFVGRTKSPESFAPPPLPPRA